MSRWRTSARRRRPAANPDGVWHRWHSRCLCRCIRAVPDPSCRNARPSARALTRVHGGPVYSRVLRSLESRKLARRRTRSSTDRLLGSACPGDWLRGHRIWMCRGREAVPVPGTGSAGTAPDRATAVRQRLFPLARSSVGRPRCVRAAPLRSASQTRSLRGPALPRPRQLLPASTVARPDVGSLFQARARRAGCPVASEFGLRSEAEPSERRGHPPDERPCLGARRPRGWRCRSGGPRTTGPPGTSGNIRAEGRAGGVRHRLSVAARLTAVPAVPDPGPAIRRNRGRLRPTGPIWQGSSGSICRPDRGGPE